MVTQYRKFCMLALIPFNSLSMFKQQQALSPVYIPPTQIPKKTVGQASQTLSEIYSRSPLTYALTLLPEPESTKILALISNYHFCADELRSLKKQNPLFKTALDFYKEKAIYLLNNLKPIHIPHLKTIDSLIFASSINSEIRNYIMKKAVKDKPFDYKVALPHSSDIQSYDISYESNKFVSLTHDKEVIIWDLSTGNSFILTTLPNTYGTVRLSPSGKKTLISIKPEPKTPFIFEIWNNAEKSRIHSWNSKRLPLILRDSIYINSTTVVAIGKNKENAPLSQYFLNHKSTEPVIKTTASSEMHRLTDLLNPALISFNSDFTFKLVPNTIAFIPKKSVFVSFFTAIINNATSLDNLEPIKKTAEYNKLNALEQNLINELIEKKKTETSLLSSLANQFGSPARQTGKAYGILQ